ncbi:Rad4-domain-containing protein [Annulohypoxylon maeteangense]|uniref:Rad4-domain-containing protein n=1 Tax=Annulohypoxylon maeteangense TaxID=1927788 RepID=UPI0020081094|nr:Rad4-domain-containing protein [Annulohypoxylon maeteangense]KAI0890287.1 Rad4-domain-containing protein [Annulohypoxylon maeteangense]
MPPYVPRKRVRTPSPENNGQATKKPDKGKGKATAVVSSRTRKATLFDDLDSGSKRGSAEKTKSAVQQMHDDSDDSSLSSLSDVDFEDVPAAKRQKVNHDSEESEDEDMEFEDVPSHEPEQPEPEIELEGDLELTLHQSGYVPLVSELGKKGASKKEKAMRITTHCMHVQLLLWHNAVRNSWLCDKEVQAIMISHLPPRLWEEVDRWRRNSGLDLPEEVPKKKPARGKGNTKGKGKQRASTSTRNWSDAADRLEKGVPDMSHGDPLFRLMKCLVSWWKQRFRIIAPGLRKWGYMSARRLGKLRSSFETEDHDPGRFGERIRDLEEFRQRAQDCSGSRDLGSQLFTALLRGLGLEARMVANLQSLGFGRSRVEEAEDENSVPGAQTDPKKPTESTPKKPNGKKKKSPVKPTTRRTRKTDSNALRMELDDSDEYGEPLTDESDNSSIVDITDIARPKRAESKAYDKDLEFPHYWTEVLSPVTKKILPVEPIVKAIVATSRDLIESLEPRGGKAEKAKQVMAYCIGFSEDGTAKDVTVRYLKKNIFPGKTKGFRMPEEKIPIYNKHGKVKRYDQFDWFKSVMRGYVRGDRKHPITEVDEEEDSTELKPAKPEKKEVKEGEETLQYYKTSKEYVLRRHLKREEALLPDAAPVKVFQIKKKASQVEEEDVYLRKDVVAVKSAETWHKQGRAPRDGAEPLKHAPYRAATTNRRREIAEAEALTGRKVMQPLYSLEQTDWIIPPPIQNGVIPKNEYGNIDMFVEHMCPEGAVHVPYRGVVRVCKRLEVDYAEAVVGFEFGHRMAVPVIQGVVIAEETYERVMEELEKDEAERARKEDEKRRKEVLAMWRKFLMGLRIADRFKQDYGHLDESVEVFGHDTGTDKDFEAMRQRDEDMAGGFLPEGYEEEETTKVKENKENSRQTSGFFPVANDEEDDSDDGNDPFEVDFGKEEADILPSSPSEQEVPVHTAPKKAAPNPKAKPKQTARRRTRRKRVTSSEDDDDEDFVNSDSG